MVVSLLKTSAPFCTFTLATPAPVTPVQLRSPHSLLRTKQVQRALIGQCMDGYHSRVAVCMSRRCSVDAAVQHCKGRTLDTQYTRVCGDCCRAKHGNHPPISHRAKKAASFVHGTFYSAASLPGTSCSRVPLPAVYPNSCKPSKSNAHSTAALNSFRASNSWRATTPRRPETADRDLSVDLAAVILLEQKSNPPTASVISFWGLQCGSPPET